MKGQAKSNGSGANARSSGTSEKILAEILAITRSHPGIRPSEINRLINREQSDSLPATLIRRGLVRRVRDGQVTCLYAR